EEMDRPPRWAHRRHEDGGEWPRTLGHHRSLPGRSFLSGVPHTITKPHGVADRGLLTSGSFFLGARAAKHVMVSPCTGSWQCPRISPSSDMPIPLRQRTAALFKACSALSTTSTHLSYRCRPSQIPPALRSASWGLP